MKKKLTGFLAVFACVLALTACGGTNNADTQEIPEETISALYGLTETTAQSLDEVVKSGTIEEQKDNTVVYSGLQSWESAKAEIGEIDFSTDADSNGRADCSTEKSISTDDDGNYIVTLEVAGAAKTADLVITYNKDLTDYVSLVTNVNYTRTELIQQAGLNTLLGMGTTFAVLILLSLIIAAFGKIFTTIEKKRIEEQVKKDKEEQEKAKQAEKSAPAAQTAAPAPASEDGVIVAVITAAIEAYRAEAEPDVEPGAFVVRRVRRVRRK